MASLTYESEPRRGWRLRVYHVGDSTRRHSIWVGDVSQREANVTRLHVEAIIESQKLGTPMPGETQRWLSKIAEPLRKKLAPLLGAARTVREASDAFLTWTGQTHKPATLTAYESTLRQFTAHYGTQQMRSLAAGDVDRWLGNCNVAPNTIAKYARHLQAFFNWCKRRGWLDDLSINASRAVGVGDKLFLESDMLQRWIDHFRSEPQMAAALAISRWAGIRVPSELLTLTRSSVDWEEKRFFVQDSKRSKRQSRGPPVVRKTPLFPELAEYLVPVWEMDGQPHDPLLPDVVRMGRAAFDRRCRAALGELGIGWPRLFTSVRATRETELIRRFGLKAACEWIGNSPAVALKHYEQITAETWREATAE